MAKLGRWLGDRDAEVSMLETKAAAMKVAFNALMVDTETGAVCDGLCVDPRTAHSSIHSSFYSLAFGLVNAKHVPGTFAYIKRRLAQSTVGFPGGPYPIQFLLVALYSVETDGGAAGLNTLTDARLFRLRLRLPLLFASALLALYVSMYFLIPRYSF